MQPLVELLQHVLNPREGGAGRLVRHAGFEIVQSEPQRRDLLAEVVVQISRDSHPLVVLGRDQAARQGGQFAGAPIPFDFELLPVSDIDQRGKAFA